MLDDLFEHNSKVAQSFYRSGRAHEGDTTGRPIHRVSISSFDPDTTRQMVPPVRSDCGGVVER
jgi:hypothetical protein